MSRLRVLFVVSECVPFVKTGGLGDVAGALPQALAARGHDVRLIMPRYRATKHAATTPHASPLCVPLGGHERWCAIHETRLDGVPVYLLEHDVLYDRDGVYGDSHGSFGDNILRYALLSRAALMLGRHLGVDFDVLHAHDWQAAMVPVYSKWLGRPEPTVLTIHNLGYQGRAPAGDTLAMGIGWADAVGLGLEYFGDLNLLKGGIETAWLISTVSPRYALEIQTPPGGAGLDGPLRARRGDVVGILNGIDDAVWDPARDVHLPASYSAHDMHGKRVCKRELQRELGLEERPDVPLVGLVSRFAEQKGIDVFAAALEQLLGMDMQFAVLGAGEGWLVDLFARVSSSTHNFRARFGLDERLAHRIEAGADLFIMPSRYEPCGLNQLYSQRYGTLPVVRAVGGLADTVAHELTGFAFEELSVAALVGALGWAADTYRYRPDHFRSMQRMAMSKQMGWDTSAAQYEALYRLALSRRR